MSEVKLKPCPFCGGAAERVDIEDGDNAGGSFVHCTTCDASGNVEFEFKENFISNWNRRVSPPADEPVAYLIERLAGAGFGDPRSIVDAAKYDPRRDDFWVGDAKTRHLVTPLYASQPTKLLPVAWRYRYNGQWYISQSESFALNGFDVHPLYACPTGPSA